MKRIIFLFLFLLPSFAFADETITLGTVNDYGVLFGRSSDIGRIATPFSPTGSANTVIAHIPMRYYAGGYMDDVTVSIETNLGSSPSGTVLGTASIPSSSIPIGGYCDPVTDIQDVTISGLTLSPSTQYWIVVDRNGTYRPPNDDPTVCMQATPVNSKYELDGGGGWNAYLYLVGTLDLSSGSSTPPTPSTSTSTCLASDFNSTSSPCYYVIGYFDWLILNGFILFFLSLMTLGIFYSLWSTRTP